MDLNFLPPRLTEAWATAYLQILVGLFVFALGIPALAFQLIVREDVRHVAQHRMRVRGWLLSTLALFLSSILFVWILHPLSARDENTLADMYPRTTAYLAAAIVTLTPSLAAWFGVRLISGHRRSEVIKRLARDLKESYATRGYFDKTVFDDLVYLGEHSQGGEEKQAVLDVMAGLARDVQRSRRYEGCELDDLLRGFETVTCNRQYPGDDANFCHAADVLKEVWFKLRRRTMYSDASVARNTLKNLGLTAVTHKSEQTALAYIDEGAITDSGLVFEIGFAALSAKRFLIAAAALNRLEALAEAANARTERARHVLGLWDARRAAALEAGDEKTLERRAGLEMAVAQRAAAAREVAANLFGLVSHFMLAGTSARMRANWFLTRSAGDFPPLEESLDSAFDYHYLHGRYETSDRIDEFRRSLPAPARAAADHSAAPSPGRDGSGLLISPV